MTKKRKRKQTQPPRTGPRCPACNRRTLDTGPSDLYWCDHCRASFDLSGDDGGDYFDDPTKRLEVQERRQEMQRSRR